MIDAVFRSATMMNWMTFSTDSSVRIVGYNFTNNPIQTAPSDSGQPIIRLPQRLTLGIIDTSRIQFIVSTGSDNRADYVPLQTKLLLAAHARGLRTADGLGMLLHQAVRGFELWFGERPQVTSELRALVETDLTKA